MRLTADLILRSPTFENCLKQRELDLRGTLFGIAAGSCSKLEVKLFAGNKIPFIENLGATHDEYEALDLSDNEIGKLDNFPLLKVGEQLDSEIDSEKCFHSVWCSCLSATTALQDYHPTFSVLCLV